MNRIWTFISTSEAETDQLGAWLAACLPKQAAIALVGTLGAGKTHLVRAIAKAVYIDPQAVVSPTFVLLQEYQSDEALIAHFDAYRLKDSSEFLDLGAGEYFERRGWTFVEWADRVADCLPPDLLRIEIELEGANARKFAISSDSDRFAEFFELLEKVASQDIE